MKSLNGMVVVALVLAVFGSTVLADVTPSDLASQIAALQTQLQALRDAAAAQGAGTNGQPSFINSYVNLGDVRYSRCTSKESGGRYDFSLGFDISSGVVTNASVNLTRDSADSTHGVVSEYISGLLDILPTPVTWNSQFDSMSRRGGLYFSTYAGIGAVYDMTYSGTTWVNGPLFSDASIAETLSGVVSVGYSSASYNEMDASTSSWTDEDGQIHILTSPAKFYINATWDVYFDTAASASMAANSMPAMELVTTPTPEPATMALLVIGGIAMIRRRRN